MQAMRCAIATVMLAVTAGQAQAAFIINAPGIFNIEWLELSYTKGLTRNQVESLIASDSFYSGYRYASAAEVSSLLNSYSGVSSLSAPISTGWYSEMGADSAAFYAQFGLLDSQSGGNYSRLRSGFIYGTTSEAPSGASYVGFVQAESDRGVIYDGYYFSGYGWDPNYSTRPTVLNDRTWSDISVNGSLLVRDVPANQTPEPTSIALAGIGMAAGVWRRRRQAKQQA